MKNKFTKLTLATLSVGLLAAPAFLSINNDNLINNAFNVQNENHFKDKVKRSYDQPQEITSSAELEFFIPGITIGGIVPVLSNGMWLDPAPDAGNGSYIRNNVGSPGLFRVVENNLGFQLSGRGNFVHSQQNYEGDTIRMYSRVTSPTSADVFEIYIYKGQILFLGKTLHGNSERPGVDPGSYYDFNYEGDGRYHVTATDYGIQFPSNDILDDWVFKMDIEDSVEHQDIIINSDTITEETVDITVNFDNSGNVYSDKVLLSIKNLNGDNVYQEEKIIGPDDTQTIFNVSGLEKDTEYEILVEYFNGDFVLQEHQGPSFTTDLFLQTGNLELLGVTSDSVDIGLESNVIGNNTDSFEIEYKLSSDIDWTRYGDINDIAVPPGGTIDDIYRIENLPTEDYYDFRFKFNSNDGSLPVYTPPLEDILVEDIEHLDTGIIDSNPVNINWESITFNVAGFNSSTANPSYPINLSKIMIRTDDENNGEWIEKDYIIDAWTDNSKINTNHTIEGLSMNKRYDVKISHFHLDDIGQQERLISETDVVTFTTNQKPEIGKGFISESAVTHNSIDIELSGFNQQPELPAERAEIQYAESGENFANYVTGKILYDPNIIDGTYRVNSIPLDFNKEYDIRISYYDGDNNSLGNTNVLTVTTNEGQEYEAGEISLETANESSVSINLDGFVNGGNGIEPFSYAFIMYKEVEDQFFQTSQAIDLSTTNPNGIYTIDGLDAEVEYEFKVQYVKPSSNSYVDTNILTAMTTDVPGSLKRGDVTVSNIAKESFNVNIQNFEQAMNPNLKIDNVLIQISSNSGNTWVTKKEIRNIDQVNGTHEVTGLKRNTNYEVKVVYRKGNIPLRETLEYVEIKTKPLNWLAIGLISGGAVVVIGLVTFGIVKANNKGKRKKFF